MENSIEVFSQANPETERIDLQIAVLDRQVEMMAAAAGSCCCCCCCLEES